MGQDEGLTRDLPEGRRRPEGTPPQSSPDCVKLLDAAGCILRFNESGLRAMESQGFESVRGRYWPSLWPPQCRSLVEQSLRDARRGETATFTAECPTGKGAPKWWDVTVTMLPGVEQFVAISRDITAQHMADLAANRSNERLHSILNATADVLWDIDLRNGRVWWGPGMRSVFGYAPDQIGPRMEWRHAHIHPEDRDRVVDSMTTAIRNGDVTWEGEFRYRKADGHYLDVLDRGSILRSASGEALRFVGVMQDITKRKAAADRQETLAREFAHRVNNTLAVVQGIFYQTKSYCSDLDTFAEKFTARILALAAANRVVAHNESGANLEKLATEQLAAFIGEERVTIGGPEAMLDTELVQALALVLNELATNAMKYGSLSSSQGRASLTWRYEREHGEEVLAIRWVESGGPPVRTPATSGLGSKLIDEAIPGAEVHRDFNVAGFSCSIVLPRRVLDPYSSVENLAAAS